MIRWIMALGFALTITTALAQREEPVGCDKFKWPLDRERALLTTPDIVKIESGTEIAPPIGKAVLIRLVSLAEAKLPMTPERTPRSPDRGTGFVKITSLSQPGNYLVTLSAGGWIDVVQGGHFVKSSAFSGALGCEGVRKSVTFALAAAPLTVQFSGVPADAVGMTMTQQ